MCIMESDNNKNKKKLKDWLTRCEAIAGSNSSPEDQVIVLRAMLLRAAVDGVNWHQIYRSIYERWHPERPCFPDLHAIAAEIEQALSDVSHLSVRPVARLTVRRA
jgi:type II secretory pathway component PulM